MEELLKDLFKFENSLFSWATPEDKIHEIALILSSKYDFLGDGNVDLSCLMPAFVNLYVSILFNSIFTNEGKARQIQDLHNFSVVHVVLKGDSFHPKPTGLEGMSEFIDIPRSDGREWEYDSVKRTWYDTR